MSGSGLISSSAGTYDPTEDYRKAHDQRMERGVRNLQILGAVGLYQNHKLSASVENLNNNLQQQTAILEGIAGGINSVAAKIDEVKQEQVLQRLKQEREEIAKETIFQFKQECE